MTYKWIHPPLKLVEEYDETLPFDLQITQDDLNQASVHLRNGDIVGEDRKMYELSAFEEEEDVEEVIGFFLAGDTDLTNPRAADVFVAMRDYSVYAPIGQHAQGEPQHSDYLISIEDYEAISRGIYTPAVYTCEVVRTWDPHKSLRPETENV